MVQQYLPSGDYTSSILDVTANLPSSQPISISSTSRRQRQMVRIQNLERLENQEANDIKDI